LIREGSTVSPSDWKIVVAGHAGFCPGVKRATDIAFRTAEKAKQIVYTIGPLIHNPDVIAELDRAGVKVIDSVDDISQGTVIVRSHGLPPDQIAKAKTKGLTVIDATCPFVRKAQDYAHLLYQEGYLVVIIGDADHPETKAILGHTGPGARVAACVEDLDDLVHQERIGVVFQTTQYYLKCKHILARLLMSSTELKIYNTMCSTSWLRQEEAIKLASEVDLMLVVGGKNSANTKRLAEICREEGVNCYLVENSTQIDPLWFTNGIRKVGITAGASTPEDSIEAVVARLNQLKTKSK
jgi:(E)-4-hydroxy-3-methyl-but-2-enyl pyrophosphate reductase